MGTIGVRFDVPEVESLTVMLEVVILAAGQGTRMRSALPKVLHPLANQPLLHHVLETARQLSPQRLHVVIGHGADAVRERLDAPDINWIEQKEQLGTGHAVLQAIPSIDVSSQVLVLYGDVPLLRHETLASLANNSPALLTAQLDDPTGYGRVVRDHSGELKGVVEHKDASDEQRLINEINTGVLVFPAALLGDYLPRVGNANAQGEYYLPDVLAMAVDEGHCVIALRADEASETMGINDRQQLAEAESLYRKRTADALMREGVSLLDPSRIDVRGRLSCDRDVIIDVNCVFEGEVHLGPGVRIGANCVLKDCSISEGSVIHPMSHIDSASVGEKCNVGPFARLRPGTKLGDNARVGNFVETKNAEVGAGSKINHLSYVGDARLGEGVNIGAGTITCNYDGVNKHHTEFGNNVFVGSNSTLVAPISIGDGGFVAAGSTVTVNVPEEALGVARGKQRNISGWKTPKQRNSNS
ncbi:MAG: bifunctional UDP-N-acetylglucosamine diphosphorylase/glucosamine-1-phosphate N-acetyltransferase GlmU [Congregibacter sp.]